MGQLPTFCSLKRAAERFAKACQFCEGPVSLCERLILQYWDRPTYVQATVPGNSTWASEMTCLRLRPADGSSVTHCDFTSRIASRGDKARLSSSRGLGTGYPLGSPGLCPPGHRPWP